MLRIMMVLFFSLLFAVNTYAQSANSHHRSKAHHKDHHAKKTMGFPLQRAATGNRVFIFNPRTHAWAAYDENGERVNTGRASGGRAYCRDIHRGCKTIVGTFHVISKGGPSCRSKRYPIRTGGGAPMPYCMHFSPKGYAIHGASSVPNYNASHGCIRVSRDAARWLSQEFVEVGTTVMVLSY